MRVTYDWTEADWNEAVTLATEDARRRGSIPGMVYALMGILLIGTVMDGVRSVRGTGKLTGAGMAVPILLVLLAALLGGGMLFARLQRRKRLRLQLPMPVGQWEAVLQEAGWRFHAKPADVPATPALTGLEKDAVVADSPAPENAPAIAAALPGEAVVIASVPQGLAAEANSVAAVELVHVPDENTKPDSVAPAETAAAEASMVAETTPKPEPAIATVEVSTVKVEAAASHEAPRLDLIQVPVEASLSEAAVAGVAKTETPLLPWKELTGSRAGDRVIVFLHTGGFHAVPIRCMTPEQASHLHRMVLRKLRPTPVQADR